MAVLVIAEHNNQTLNAATAKIITCAQQIAGDVEVLLAGSQADAVANEIAELAGVSKVIYCDNNIFQHVLAENLAALIVQQAKNYSHILAPATTMGKNVMPRVAALLDVAQISDIIAVLDSDTFKRPIYAGNAIATVKSSDNCKVITVRPVAFAAAEKSGNTAPIDKLSDSVSCDKVEFIKQELNISERPELTAAKVVISGGRGLQNGENFKLLEALADKFDAAIGASRAAVDAGYVPNDYQVGQTGKVVAPDLYIAIGISGAIQHLAGMKDSKIIVAINKDEDAPIFQIADYGLVGDLFDIVPKLTELLA